MNLTFWRIVAAIAGVFIYSARSWGMPDSYEDGAFNIMAASLVFAGIVPQAWRATRWIRATFALVGLSLVGSAAYLVYRDLTDPYITDYVAAVLKVGFAFIFFPAALRWSPVVPAR